FVVIALVAEIGGSGAQVEAFGTPTVVHFSATLLLSIVLTAPWPSLLSASLAIAALGIAGTVYMVITVGRARRQTDYRPVFEDWLFYMTLPLVSYVAVLAAALGLASRMTLSLFVVGAAGVLLLFIGIHNAWDTVTYVVVERMQRRRRGRTDGDAAE